MNYQDNGLDCFLGAYLGEKKKEAVLALNLLFVAAPIRRHAGNVFLFFSTLPPFVPVEKAEIHTDTFTILSTVSALFCDYR